MRVPSLVAGLALLAGCTTEVGLHETAAATFGGAYQRNELIQSAAWRRGAFLEAERARFAAEARPVVTFAFDQATLDAEARAALDAQAAWLAANPDVRVRIAGHTDLVGGEDYNDRLGLRRARAAARHLIARGIARNRIDAVESRGEREPVIATEARERRNRRTETAVAGFVHGYVGDGMDGRRARVMYTRYVTDSVETPASANTSAVSAGGG